MKKNILEISILTLLLFGILIVGEISYNEFIYGGICPNFTIIPACYIALVYLILLIIFQILKRIVLPFILLSGFALTIAIYTSIGHSLEVIQCPMSDTGIPTCYVIAIIFLSLLILKFIQIKNDKRT